MPALASFDYAIVRVVPRVERCEFINAGVILFCRTRRYLKARVELDRQRLQALAPHYPAVKELHLVDYKVRILDGKTGTAAATRVLVDTQRANRRWSTVGASTNIIEASWRAIVDAIEYGLKADAAS